ncbi:MAG: hypothetical protein ACLRZX_04665 [Coprobacillus cateniformis]
MAVFGTIYEPMSHQKKDLMNRNDEHLANMLDYAIQELVEIASDNDIWLVNDSEVCKSYEDIFSCLKARFLKRTTNEK